MAAPGKQLLMRLFLKKKTMGIEGAGSTRSRSDDSASHKESQEDSMRQLLTSSPWDLLSVSHLFGNAFYYFQLKPEQGLYHNESRPQAHSQLYLPY